MLFITVRSSFTWEHQCLRAKANLSIRFPLSGDLNLRPSGQKIYWWQFELWVWFGVQTVQQTLVSCFFCVAGKVSPILWPQERVCVCACVRLCVRETLDDSSIPSHRHSNSYTHTSFPLARIGSLLHITQAVSDTHASHYSWRLHLYTFMYVYPALSTCTDMFAWEMQPHENLLQPYLC